MIGRTKCTPFKGETAGTTASRKTRMITESQIKAAKRSASVTGKKVELKDGGERRPGG